MLTRAISLLILIAVSAACFGQVAAEGKSTPRMPDVPEMGVQRARTSRTSADAACGVYRM